MLSKLCAWGKSRPEAIQRLKAAILDYQIKGPKTTLPFGTFVLEHEAFTSGKFDTHFVKNYFTPEKLEEKERQLREVAAMIGLHAYLEEKRRLKEPEVKDSHWTLREGASR